MSSNNNNNNNNDDDGGGKLPAEAMSKSAQDIAMKMLQDATFNMATTMMAQAAAAAPSIAPLQPPLQSTLNDTAELAAAQVNPEATAVSVPQSQPAVNNNSEVVNPTTEVEEEKEAAVPSDENPDGTWNCTKCGFINPPAKTRCANDNAPNGRCLSWRGGKRSPAKWKVLPTQSIGDSKADEGGGGHATRGRTSGNRKTYSDGKKAYQLDDNDEEETSTNKHGTRGSNRKKTPSSKEKSKASASSSTTSRPRSGSKTSASKQTNSQSKSNKKPSPPNTNNKPPPSKEKGEPKPPDNPLLGDPKVVPAVHSIIHLLQTYGPLSYEQLKFNMVPQLVPPTISPANEIKQVVPPKTLPPPKLGQLQAVEKEREAEKEKERELKKNEIRPPKDKLQKVLDILYELGIIHIIDKSKLKQESDVDYATGGATLDDVEKDAESAATKKQPDSISSNSEYNPTAETFVKAFEDTNPIYCFGGGVPRMDSIMPSRILTEIKQTGEEVLRMKQRVEILKKTLMLVDKESKEGVGGESSAKPVVDAAATTAETTMEVEQPDKQLPKSEVTPEQHAVNTLKQLFQDHPEIVNDPVYAAALRMFRINVGNKIDHHKIYVDNGAEVAMITDKILLGGDNTGNKKKQGAASSNQESQRGLKRSASSDSAGGKRKRQRKKQVKQGRPAKPKQARKSNSSDSLKSSAMKSAAKSAAATTDRHNEEWGSGVI